jgi:hypothetical protein
MKAKKYSDEDNSRTDVNGAWKPLSPLSKDFDFFSGDDNEFDNFKGRRKAIRQEKQDLRQSGLSRKNARKQAKMNVPLTPQQRENAHKVLKGVLVTPRGAFIALLRLNYRGFAWKIDAILNGSDAKLKTKLTEKWYGLGGEIDKLIEGTNAGKVKKPFFCGKACKRQLIEKKSSFSGEPHYYPTGVEEGVVAFIIENATIIIKSLTTILSSVIVASSKKKEINSAERVANKENETLSQAEKDKIALEEKKIKAETDPRNQIINDPSLTEEEKQSALKLLDEAEGSKLNKDVVKYVVIGGIALVAIFLISKTLKK